MLGLVLLEAIDSVVNLCHDMYICRLHFNELHFVVAVPNAVPDVMVVSNSVTLDNDTATFTLSWGEPFNNFDPIISYTVICSGDVSCPPDFNTTDNTTRNYTITNLISGTNYTFSVIAINSINQGSPGTLIITAPSGMYVNNSGLIVLRELSYH